MKLLCSRCGKVRSFFRKLRTYLLVVQHELQLHNLSLPQQFSAEKKVKKNIFMFHWECHSTVRGEKSFLSSHRTTSSSHPNEHRARRPSRKFLEWQLFFLFSSEKSDEWGEKLSNWEIFRVRETNEIIFTEEIKITTDCELSEIGINWIYWFRRTARLTLGRVRENEIEFGFVLSRPCRKIRLHATLSWSDGHVVGQHGRALQSIWGKLFSGFWCFS